MKAATHNKVNNKPGKTCWKFWSWKYFPLQHTPHHLTKQTQELNQKTCSSKQGQYRWCTLHHHKQQQTFHLDYGSNSAFRSTWSISFRHQLACDMTHSHDKIYENRNDHRNFLPSTQFLYRHSCLLKFYKQIGEKYGEQRKKSRREHTNIQSLLFMLIAWNSYRQKFFKPQLICHINFYSSKQVTPWCKHWCHLGIKITTPKFLDCQWQPFTICNLQPIAII